ncbi:MAG TPA: hypothetical protein VKI62_02490, partial [Bacteroidota bacterium]|nr:hypothetical protein [Bacteroidota bacterium]
IHEFIHGLSAPAFLFGAGLTFVISTRRRWEAFHHWGDPLARRMKRIVMIILLGLAIHLPFFSIRKIILDGTMADYLQLFQCDVLHCIGIGLLLLHGLVFFFKTESRFYGLVVSAVVTVCFLTPLIWSVDFLSYLPPALAQLCNGIHGSPFPLFPYVGFLFAGVVVSWEFLLAVREQRERRFMIQLAIIGCALVLTGMVLDLLPVTVYPVYNYWFTSPNYFLVRIGTLLTILPLFWFWGKKFTKPKPVMTVLGRESLFVYVLHLVVLYGSAVNPTENLQVIFGQQHTIQQIVLIFFVFVAVMFFAALFWSYLKEKHLSFYRLTQLAGSGAFLYYFFTRDF